MTTYEMDGREWMDVRWSGVCRQKLWGRLSRPQCRCLLQLVSVSCCFSSLLFSWLPWIYSPFPFFMEFRNGVLLQLIECIESTKNEVKRKMIITDSCSDVRKSSTRIFSKKKLHDVAMQRRGSNVCCEAMVVRRWRLAKLRLTSESRSAAWFDRC
jgi:hypothetical protein